VSLNAEQGPNKVGCRKPATVAGRRRSMHRKQNKRDLWHCFWLHEGFAWLVAATNLAEIE